MIYKQKRYHKRHQGFTLVELLLVIAIIGVLASLGFSLIGSAERDALETRTQAGIERISNVLNRKLEDFRYRTLPVRMPVGAPPEEVRALHLQAMAELLRVEFPFLLVQVNPSSNFPQNDSAPINSVSPPLTLPNIVTRYSQRVSGASVNFQDAELLYAILSLNFDEFGQPLSAVLREREIGDTDNDGCMEVLDAFGDPLEFRIGDTQGREIILSQTQTLDANQVRGPLPIEDVRFWIRSLNVPTRDGSAVVTQ